MRPSTHDSKRPFRYDSKWDRPRERSLSWVASIVESSQTNLRACPVLHAAQKFVDIFNFSIEWYLDLFIWIYLFGSIYIA